VVFEDEKCHFLIARVSTDGNSQVRQERPSLWPGSGPTWIHGKRTLAERIPGAQQIQGARISRLDVIWAK
jgi:hypothetical protein